MESIDNYGHILILDGAMGSLLQTLLPDLVTQGDKLCLSNPAVVTQVHEAYLEAGADIIETCSFNNTGYETARAAAHIARAAADRHSSPGKPRFVAGSLGPGDKCASLTPDMDNPSRRFVTFDELAALYYDNARGLIEGGADFLLIETAFDTLNVKAALFAARRLSRAIGRHVPAAVSFTVNETGRLLTGLPVAEAAAALLPYDLAAAGLNCSFGAETLLPHLRALASSAPWPLIVYPNAGLPDAQGAYGDGPETMAAAMEAYFREGLATVAGGCCGSTPDHIRAIAAKAASQAPRRSSPDRAKELLRSFADEAARQLAMPADEAFTKAYAASDWEDAAEEARSLAEGGGEALVLRPDGAKEAAETMTNFHFLAGSYPDLARLPVVIESADADLVVKGLKCVSGKAAVRYTGSDGEAAREAADLYGGVLV
jgi:5-methyltetrahydrofolate--homocysteine methyltransferase